MQHLQGLIIALSVWSRLIHCRGLRFYGGGVHMTYTHLVSIVEQRFQSYGVHAYAFLMGDGWPIDFGSDVYCNAVVHRSVLGNRL